MERFCGSILKDELLVLRGKDLPLPENVITDSRKVVPGCVFIAIPGCRVDGHGFIPEAEKKAALIVHSRELPVYHPDKNYMLVKDSAAAAALLIRAAYGDPDEELDLYGVTGTNGKTTTVFLLEHLLQNCGLISTAELHCGGKAVAANCTTPPPEQLFRLFSEMRSNHLKAAAMELSSHALDQHRVSGVCLKAAIFTNLTGDHMDYHKDMEHYYQAKKRLFTELLSPEGTAVVNVDDPWGRRLADELAGLRNTVTFSFSGEANWQIKNLKSSFSGIDFDLVSGTEILKISSNLIGRFNAANLTGAVLAVKNCGMSIQDITAALQKKITVPGRLQFIHSPGGAGFTADYAHTDDALRNVLAALRPMTGNRLICVFGAGGDRDKSKRPRMGAAAAAADTLIVTSDNPRSEDPEKIIADITAGIPAGTEFEIIPDRRKAILRACSIAEKGDIVLIAGKGHEDYQEIKGIRYPFSDLAVVKEFIGDK